MSYEEIEQYIETNTIYEAHSIENDSIGYTEAWGVGHNDIQPDYIIGAIKMDLPLDIISQQDFRKYYKSGGREYIKDLLIDSENAIGENVSYGDMGWEVDVIDKNIVVWQDYYADVGQEVTI